MGNKTRHTANLVSDNNLFVDIANDRVGIGSTQPTAKLNVVGVVSATSFRGDGSQLSGISVDSTSLVDSNGVTRVQATTTGAVVTGILTATSFDGVDFSGKANVTISDAPPGIGTAHGDLWWESDTAKGHIYYNDGSSAQWVEFNPASGGGGGGGGGGSYANSDVDNHLNVASASAGEILSWNGSDYAWVADQTGGSGITTANINADTLNVSGVSTFQSNVQLLDNDKLLIGGSLGSHDGLEIYHDTNHSYIDDSGTGNLYLRSGTLSIQNLAGSKTSALFQSGSGQELYYNNSKKFETIGYGVSVTGTTFSNQLSVSGIITATSFSGITTSMISDYGNGISGGGAVELVML